MSKPGDLKEFNYCFQLSRAIVFEVNYYRLGNNVSQHFSTSAALFNRPKTDYNQCGQAQNDLLKGFNKAMNFYKKWDKCHCLPLTADQHKQVIEDIEVLKQQYNYIESEYHNIPFDRVKQVSMQPVKKHKLTTVNNC